MSAKTTKVQGLTRPVINLDDAANAIMECFIAEKGAQDARCRLTPMLLGAPGQGKTAIVDKFEETLNTITFENWFKSLPESEQAELTFVSTDPKYKAFTFEELQAEEARLKRLALNRYKHSGEMWKVLHFRLSQCDPTDLKGVPIYGERVNDDGESMQFCTFAPPATFPINGFKHPHKVIIFLDEIPQANPTIQNLASSILDSRVGDHELDFDRTFFIAAGNRKEDLAAVFDTPRNVANRVMYLDVITSLEEWKDWAVSSKLNPYVIGFLDSNASHFNEPPPKDIAGPYGTPRSWHKASQLINSFGERFVDPKNALGLQMLIGLVGFPAASKFHTWLANAQSKYKITDIFAGKKVAYPDAGSRDVIFGLLLEGTFMINEVVEKIASTKGWIEAKDLAEKAKVVEDFLKKEKIRGVTAINAIENLYAWVDYGYSHNNQIDAAFAVLLNKYQSEEARSILRPAMTYSSTQKGSPFVNINKYYLKMASLLMGPRK